MGAIRLFQQYIGEVLTIYYNITYYIILYGGCAQSITLLHMSLDVDSVVLGFTLMTCQHSRGSILNPVVPPQDPSEHLLCNSTVASQPTVFHVPFEYFMGVCIFLC